MSNEIDWSKAPEGYPVWIQDLTGQKPDGSGWHREETATDDSDDDPCERWVDVAGKYWPKDCEARGKIIVHRKPVEEWTGTGLPPVGTVCECQNDAFKWLQGVIVHVGTDRGKKIAIMQCENEMLWGESGEFRPIRTPEQIAAEEREKAVNAMVATAGLLDKGWCRKVCESLYDAGYRSVEDK